MRVEHWMKYDEILMGVDVVNTGEILHAHLLNILIEICRASHTDLNIHS